jgi:hypothetical protein
MTTSSANPRIKSKEVVLGNKPKGYSNQNRIDDHITEEESPETVVFISGITTYKVKF